MAREGNNLKVKSTSRQIFSKLLYSYISFDKLYLARVTLPPSLTLSLLLGAMNFKLL